MAVHSRSRAKTAEGVAASRVRPPASRGVENTANANAAPGTTVAAARRLNDGAAEDQQAAILLSRIRARGEKLSVRIDTLRAKLS